MTTSDTETRRRGLAVYLLLMLLAVIGTALLLISNLDDDAGHVDQTDIGQLETGPGSPTD